MIVLRSLLRRSTVPVLVVFLLIGILLNALDAAAGARLLGEEGRSALGFLSMLGLFALLFRAGLESNPRKLRKELGKAGLIWIGNFVISGLLGFAVAFTVLGIPLVSSLVIGAALTATSITISVATWEEADAMDREEADVMLDVAEMDDISGVALLALLLALIPKLEDGGSMDQLLGSGLQVLLWFLVKLMLFAGSCLLFSRYFEVRMTAALRRLTTDASSLMLLVVGIGVLVAGMANWLGFSLAIGALFSGLMFSRDENRGSVDEAFQPIWLLFGPFFFIGIGLSVEPHFMVSGLGVGAVLVVAAVLGKVLGAAVPARRHFGWTGSLAIGLSLVPRAEIALVIAERAHELGDRILSSEHLASIVVVSVTTSLVAPYFVRKAIGRLEGTRT